MFEKMKLQKLSFSLGPRMCLKQHCHAWCTSSQSIETDSPMLICKTTWLCNYTAHEPSFRILLCEPSMNIYTGISFPYASFKLFRYFCVSFPHLAWSFNF